MTNSKPQYIAYSVNNGSEDKSHWTRIGAAFAHRDAAGFDIVLDALPAQSGGSRALNPDHCGQLVRGNAGSESGHCGQGCEQR